MNSVKRDILDVALAEFANFGLEGTRIESIAAKTHTSKRMIYYHFGSKENLYAEVLEHAYRLVREGPVLESLEDLPPLQALTTYAGNAFDNFARLPDFIRLVQQENLQGANVVRNSPTIQEMNRITYERLERIVQRGQADGSMRKDVTPMNVYITFIGLCHYNVSARNSFRALFDYDFTAPDHSASRRQAICEAVERYARADTTRKPR